MLISLATAMIWSLRAQSSEIRWAFGGSPQCLMALVCGGRNEHYGSFLTGYL